MPTRSGTCSRCGQCCGAEGSPNQANPWPPNWPSALRTWSLDDVNELWPQMTMFGFSNLGDQIGIPPGEEAGNYRPRGQGTRYYYVWVEGHACCKDISPGHDGSSYSLECPFLMDDQGDGRRECALVGTQDDGAYTKACFPEGPLEFDTQEMVDQWEGDHPLCSFTWE
jgi:hypothetical protein